MNENALSFINRFTKTGSPVKDLSRFQGLMDALGNPQDKLKFIHIAGTNGKGSTVRFCAQALAESGYKTGEFTSPYITQYADRIRINGCNIPYEDIARLSEKVKCAVNEDISYSQFEITNAIAFLYYLEQGCDLVVLETGIGGLLDSTNVVKNTLVSVITSIDYDHTRILGNTLEEIAAHKAGIIKPGAPVVLAADNPEAAVQIVAQKAEQQHSLLSIPDTTQLTVEKCDLSGSVFSYKGEPYTLKMPGQHQIMNALSAIETLNLLEEQGLTIPLKAIKRAFAHASVCARAEVLSRNPLLMIDGAHNPSGAHSLAALIASVPEMQPVVLVAGMLAEKNVRSAVKELSSVCDLAICVDDFHPGAIPCTELAELFQIFGVQALPAESVSAAFVKARTVAGEQGAIILCGSLYLAAQARKILF